MKLNKFAMLLLAAALPCAAAMAQALSEGFYRVQNLGSGRFLYVRDCTGDVSTLGADLGALELWSGVENTLSDPASVIYLKPASPGSNQWDLIAQGTGVHQMTGMYVTLTVTSAGCMLYSDGQYLYETGTSSVYPDMGILGAGTNQTQAGRTNYRVWPVHRINNTGNDIFGIQPTCQSGNRYYTTFYADFAYSPLDDVRTYTVKQVDADYGIAVIAPVSGTVAKDQPVILDCPTNDPRTNRIDLTTSAGTTAAGNQLSGVFFCNGGRSGIVHPATPAYVRFNTATMRMLAADANGQLIFTNAPADLVNQRVKEGNQWVSNVPCVPANKAYLTVPSGCPATLRVLTEAQYQHYIDSVRPIVTSDTTLGIIGNLTAGAVRPLPCSVLLPIDSLVQMRLARVIRSVTTRGGRIISTVYDTTYYGAAQSNQYLTREMMAQGGYLCQGNKSLLLRTDASGRYEFSLSDPLRLQIAFPELPAPVITHDTTFSIAGTFTRGALRKLPYTASLPIDSTVTFRIARIARESSRVGIYDPTYTYDTLWLGPDQQHAAVSRSSADSPLSPTEAAFSLLTDASGQYRFALTAEKKLHVAFPALPVPVLSYDTAYCLQTGSADEALQPLSSRSFTLQLPIDSIYRFRFARLVTTTTRVDIRPATMSYDTLWLGAAAQEQSVVRSQRTYSVGGNGFFALAADATGRYTIAFPNDTLLRVSFPAAAVPGVTRDTLYYLQLADRLTESVLLEEGQCQLQLPIDSTIRFRFLRVIETRTIVETRPAEYTYDTLYWGASRANYPVNRNNAGATLARSAHFFALQADADGRYIISLVNNTRLQVTFPEAPVPVVDSDTAYWFTTAAATASLDPAQLHPLPHQETLAIDQQFRFRLVRTVLTTTTVGSRLPVLTADTTFLGADNQGNELTRTNSSDGFPLLGTGMLSLTADADGQFTFALLGGNVLQVSFPELPVPVVTADTAYYLSTSATGWEGNLQSYPFSLVLERDSVLLFEAVRIVETLTQVGSRRPVSASDTLLLGAAAEEASIVLRDDSVGVMLALDGALPYSLTADASGTYVIDLTSDKASLTVSFPELPEPPSTSIDNIHSDAGALTDGIYYDILGRPCGTDYRTLAPGLYIIGRTKILKR